MLFNNISPLGLKFACLFFFYKQPTSPRLKKLYAALLLPLFNLSRTQIVGRGWGFFPPVIVPICNVRVGVKKYLNHKNPPHPRPSPNPSHQRSIPHLQKKRA